MPMCLIQDAGSKVLVFSSWNTVLDHLGRALIQNHIKYTQLQGGSKEFQKALSLFKGDTGTNVLLSLISAGGKGLNIIEATHVILVEPVLNPGTDMYYILALKWLRRYSKEKVRICRKLC